VQSRSSTAVLGFRPHTYWTAVVALAGPLDAPLVLERRRITFASGAERFVYHQAAERDLARAETLIAQVRAATEANAAREIGGLLADLQRDGVSVHVAVTPAATARLPQALDEILRVHARMHAAEGNFYRDVVAEGCRRLGLEVRRVAERDLAGRVGERLGVDRATLDNRLKAMGAPLGPPWGEDFKLATQAAWAGL